MSSSKYIEDGINSNIRVDGRTLLTYRTIEINKNILVSADGSSSVMNEENNVICGVKLSLLSPSADANDEGFVNLKIDCPASVGANRIKKEHLQIMTSIIYDLCIKNNINKKKLCILPSKFVWGVDINVMVLNAGGGLLDIISIAIYVALNDMTMPIVKPKKKIDELNMFHNTKCKDYQVEIVENQKTNFPYENIPICISIGEINNKYIYDMSKIEEELVENIFVVAITSSGKCVAFHKLYGISMEISSILNMTENSIKVSHFLFEKINEAICKIRTRSALIK
ncbi:exosome complex component RRP42 [Plasmodium brasilianum]|uniref:Ribosomal RNA-processing protein 42 n=2 Tax=Plasmodium (Plasmodium) TaxID=418103 RepID=A0A1A8W858_PLAMA|nr:exosome complex component RRP42, putative [Plasmodium malariae]KAI4836388.1 exosome complex component RRP42 [Plasmodium brasilianum]SBS87874.1 exosome complex component RRP42, putative (RRP42) [Plasmodium malariae]SCO93657.1 exosome complex component RRP42, putative [Plasmodium malariae]